jgi:hypothetical protein
MKSFSLSEADLTALIQMGLFATKDAKDLWFTIPHIGKFRRNTLDARRKVIALLRKKRYREISVEELLKRNIKDLNEIGVPYLCFDLIGSEIVRKLDSPLDTVIIQLI